MLLHPYFSVSLLDGENLPFEKPDGGAVDYMSHLRPTPN